MPGKAKLCIFSFLFIFLLLSSCKTTRFSRLNTAEQLVQNFIEHVDLRHAHCGIFIKEVGAWAPVADYQSGKLFVPASNVKIITCYLAMKYGDDSLITATIKRLNNQHLIVRTMSDPTFLHPDFPRSALLDSMILFDTITIVSKPALPYGPGWSWEDYDRYFMPEVSDFPLYGNVVRLDATFGSMSVLPKYFADSVLFENNRYNRSLRQNRFFADTSSPGYQNVIPFIPDRNTQTALLLDTLGFRHIGWTEEGEVTGGSAVKGQPLDTVLKMIMEDSDNFLAEHLLRNLALVNKWEGNVGNWFSAHLPGQSNPDVVASRLVDGSGLSRYNLISPARLADILEKQWLEIKKDRLLTVYPNWSTPGFQKTFGSFGERVYAKTGSMGGIFCLSGYLFTLEKRVFVFSIMVNGSRAGSKKIQEQIAVFLEQIATQNQSAKTIFSIK
jgi:D-alanyl-D-alanine carboxypeptidase/D-alanyl-D-alanine-endopeptidase (penicillin-binding protein 4)